MNIINLILILNLKRLHPYIPVYIYLCCATLYYVYLYIYLYISNNRREVWPRVRYYLQVYIV